ncbi:MAG: NADPH dehydrogenase NamA [Chloroflexi bacterium]|nr:NADPH dehydrogenase NamA [Chloroflexota bacterium]
MPHLFEPYQIRELTLRNRVMVSPMCMYSAPENGLFTEWHFVHLASRAVGGAGLVCQEATAVESRGRISEGDLGLWDDIQIAPLQRITHFIKEAGAASAIQLAHAGRKAWSSHKGHGGPQQPVAPSAIPWDHDWEVPHELTIQEIRQIVDAFQAAAARALAAAFDVIEIHGAHGYLLHSFLSPISNQRQDLYGGSLEKRCRLVLEVAQAIRQVWPEHKPLLLRVSATDWAEGGLTPDDFVALAPALKKAGIDLIYCSSGGVAPISIPRIAPGYQIPLAERIRHGGQIATAAVGLITQPEMAEEIISNGRADLVALAREVLRHPYWPLMAAHRLGQEVAWPKQYLRAKPQ